MAQVEFEFKVTETETGKNLSVTVCKLDFRRERDIEIHLEIPYDLVSNLLEAKSRKQFSKILKVARFYETRGNKTSISGSTNIEFELDCTEVSFFSAISNRRPWVRLTLGWNGGVLLNFEFQGYQGRTAGERFYLRGASEKIPRPGVIAFVYSRRLELAIDDEYHVDPSVEYERTFPSISEGPPWIHGDYDDDYEVEDQGPYFEFDGVDRQSYFALFPVNVENYHEALDRFEDSFLVKFLSAF